MNDVSLANPEVLMTSNENKVYQSAYTYGLDRISVRYLAGNNDPKYTPLYYHYNGRGDVTSLVNTADNTKAKYRYDAFGVPKPGVKLDIDSNGFINPYGYNSEDYDMYSGIQYLRARYYEPETGRFLTRDSYLGDITNPLSLNRYTYTGNNPLMYTDPSGHLQELLQEGDIGDNVRQVQQILMDIGYNPEGGADGVFGPSTRNAVMNFQRDYDLEVDGIVGSQTYSELHSQLEGIKQSKQMSERAGERRGETIEDKIKERQQAVREKECDGLSYMNSSGWTNNLTLINGAKSIYNFYNNSMLRTMGQSSKDGTAVYVTEGDAELADNGASTLTGQFAITAVGGAVNGAKAVKSLISGETASGDFVAASGAGSMANKGAAGAGKLTGSLTDLTQAERTVINDLLSSGKNVEIIPRSAEQGVKTPDFLINGVKTELKTLTGTSLNTPVTRIQDAFKQGAQAVIIDGRGVGITADQANTILNRATGVYKGSLPGNVQIWTVDRIIGR